MLTIWNDHQWLEMFRMKRDMFYHIISMLGPHIVRQDTNMRLAIPPDKKVAMAIMKLASSSNLHYIVNQFSVATCQLFKDITANKIIHLANPQQVIDSFNKKGFLNCIGALDSTHIPVLCPAGRGRAFTNRKGYVSVILQTMVDHQGWFMNIYTGWAGSVQDARMFRNSPLPGLVEKGHYAPGVEETVIPGSPGYISGHCLPLKPWLWKPYGGNITDPQKLVFKQCLSSCRMAVEYAFG
ncbi:hypothetical protein Y1Q_0013729 [Alligator mississippiensis]|uniref:DDE Tnp4 domain-containing protein n=1 Tax=Alligator mississippiensis TaxID=8496 RepID=A0A151NW83_ALLMI|nr:hypothetical protein Y1Q_0013729 [Alligator mississippiensis]